MFVRAATIVLGLMALSGPALAQGRACERMHHDYERSEGPKAWARGSDGCGYATARSASSLGDARRRAIEACEENTRGCRIMESER